jgi:hypothetical protein
MACTTRISEEGFKGAAAVKKQRSTDVPKPTKKEQMPT